VFAGVFWSIWDWGEDKCEKVGVAEMKIQNHEFHSTKPHQWSLMGM
jgi:hypothetical protein